MNTRQICPLSLLAIATVGLSVSLTPAAQARDYVLTGPNGRTTQSTVNRQPIENGSSVQRTTTYPNGQSSSYSGTVVKTGPGSYERNGQYTGPKGNQSTLHGTGTYQNGTFNGTRTVTPANGQSRTSTLQSTP
jgi:O-acetylhomoserine/O-acetylserine sulfhydrylase-like pyridoxal-dependent enzyme